MDDTENAGSGDVVIGEGAARLMRGDCLVRLKGLADNSVDSVVTDPPYGLSDHTEQDIRKCMAAWLAGEEYKHGKAGFMSITWDSFVPGPEVWREVFRVLKPGGYVLAFASTRTDDLMSMALRLAGFRKHPFIGWCFGSGFSKAANLGKAFDKEAGAERDVISEGAPVKRMIPGADQNDTGSWIKDNGREFVPTVTAPATDAAKEWDGWYYGLQSLKPAIEPCLMFQKPHEGRMTDNVLRYGTGAINVDGGRVESTDSQLAEKYASVRNASPRENAIYGSDNRTRSEGKQRPHPAGRWPANLIHDGSAEVVALFPSTAGAGGSVPNVNVTGYGGGIGTGSSDYLGGERTKVDSGSGSAARFFKQCSLDEDDIEAARLFYCAKASKRDRDEGLAHMPTVTAAPYGQHRGRRMEGNDTRTDGKPLAVGKNHHPTVKPTDLCRYLIRLVTPKGGTTLDIFMGSGSFGKAAMLEGFNFIGIERDDDGEGNSLGYLDICAARIRHAHGQANPEPVPVAEVEVEMEPQLSLFA